MFAHKKFFSCCSFVGGGEFAILLSFTKFFTRLSEKKAATKKAQTLRGLSKNSERQLEQVVEYSVISTLGKRKCRISF